MFTLITEVAWSARVTKVLNICVCLFDGIIFLYAGLFKQRQVSSAAIASSATALFLGGFESTATSLSYIAYNLAKYPDAQEKAREEVLEAMSTTGTLDYDITMRKLKYLGQVVDETLRLYPPGLLFVTRQAKEDFEYNGMKFKAGTAFMISQYHLHRNPQFWTNPDEFHPDRFAPENEALLRKAASIVWNWDRLRWVPWKSALTVSSRLLVGDPWIKLYRV
ncbi:hypothetical protein MTO96_012842 [Rhipicephalus appendiculatus]